MIRGLRKGKEDVKEVGTEFLEEFGAGGKIKYIKMEGKKEERW